MFSTDPVNVAENPQYRSTVGYLNSTRKMEWHAVKDKCMTGGMLCTSSIKGNCIDKLALCFSRTGTGEVDISLSMER